MSNNLRPHSQRNIFTNQENGTKNKDAHGDVRQDKRAKTGARIASAQPARSHIPTRAQTMTTKKGCVPPFTHEAAQSFEDLAR
jgi:hypothetical protein